MHGFPEWKDRPLGKAQSTAEQDYIAVFGSGCGAVLDGAFDACGRRYVKKLEVTVRSRTSCESVSERRVWIYYESENTNV